jgi:hypothetical protein
VPIPCRFQKRTKQTIPEIVQNYEELKATFAHTLWGKFFKD